jgi:hypothetical protein
VVHLARKLVARLNPEVAESEACPKNVKPNKYYRVIGYQTAQVEREIKNRGGEEIGQRKVEEITGCFIIDEKRRLKFVYTSSMYFYLDKEELTDEEKVKAGSTETAEDDLPF